MRINWKAEMNLIHVRKRVVLVALVISGTFGIIRYLHTPEEASALAVALFVSLYLSVYISTRLWWVLDTYLSHQFRSLAESLTAVEDRLDRFIVSLGQNPSQYETERKRTLLQKADRVFFSFAVKFSFLFLMLAVHHLFLAYVEWQTGIFGARANLSGLYFYIGCLALTWLVSCVVYQWLTIRQVEKSVEMFNKTIGLMEEGNISKALEVKNGRSKENYERKLGMYEQVERLIHRWVAVATPA